ncbi:tetratricopeptide tpr_1 repeat-containing protein : [Gemmata massiliana]|uniref:Tetratricopeptide tpr_1 repeat-containing protein n=1 Tax=Gemmata massiliana TaxID=1210884 RepID=A0A6P2CXF3_9BACT|nr:hypothetical protein [Gemmata massiliana]VTR93267.1 tetratricopeptide tpr_1 repeat-containing protein : [Gemmata massiliana]
MLTADDRSTPLTELATRLYGQIRATGLFLLANRPDQKAVPPECFHRIGFAREFLEVLSETIGLKFAPDEVPLLYHTHGWPAPDIAGYARPDGPVKPHHTVQSYMGSWALVWQGREDGSGSAGRITKAVLQVLHARGAGAAVRYLFDCARAGYLIDEDAVTHVLLLLGEAYQCSGTDADLVARVFPNGLPRSVSEWAEYDLSAADLSADEPARDVADLADVVIDYVDELHRTMTDVRSYGEWLTHQALGRPIFAAAFRALRNWFDPVPLSLRSYIDALEENLCDAGSTQLTIFRSSEGPAADFTATYAGPRAFTLLIRHAVTDEWRTRVRERAIVPCQILDAIAARSNAGLPAHWRRLPADLAAPFAFVVKRAPVWPVIYGREEPAPESGASPATQLIAIIRANETAPPDAQLARLRAFLESYPWNHFAHHELAIARDRAGNHTEALAAISDSIVLEPRNHLAWHSLAVVLANLGHETEARIAAVVCHALRSRADQSPAPA